MYDIRKEFSEWIEDGRKPVWFRFEHSSEWRKCDAPRWIDGVYYIVDNVFAYLKMAAIDGKKIQIKITHSITVNGKFQKHYEWEEFNTNGLCFSENQEYRVKPDIEVGVGDWAVLEDGSLLRITSIAFENMSYSEKTKLKKWEPSIDEFIVIRKGDDIYSIERFNPEIHFGKFIYPIEKMEDFALYNINKFRKDAR